MILQATSYPTGRRGCRALDLPCPRDADSLASEVASQDGEQVVGLLSPAVQQVREAATTDEALDECGLNFEETNIIFTGLE